VVGTFPPQNFSVILDPRSLYTKTMSIKGSVLKSPIIKELPQNAELLKRARELRQARNLPEVLFWMQVTKGRFHQIDFDRQKVIGNYIVDFYVKRLRLIIEIDGSSHIGKEVYDRKRQNYLESLGLRVYRISTGDIKYRLGFALKELEEYVIENYSMGEEEV
jgi:very-short-patch-repair endonuclease